jgi:hypothetical protein
MPGGVQGKARKGSKMIKKILILSCVLFLYAYPGFAGEQTPARGVVAATGVELKQQVVRIRGYEGVSPLNLFIVPGTVVIWLNQYQGPIKITFLSKKVTLACKSPVNFFINEQGVFESNVVGFGAVASLCLIECGSFDYVIERSPADTSARSEGFRFEGRIVVKKK